MYVSELEDLRQECQRGLSAETVTLWAKVQSMNRAVTSPTAIVYLPDGTQLSTPSVTHDTARVDASKLSVSVDATSLDLGENYRVEWSFTYASATHKATTQFDVVTVPFWRALNISLNDILDEYPEANSVLETRAQSRRAGETPEQAAQVILHLAVKDVRTWLKRRVADLGKSWMQYIANIDDLRGVVVARALARMFLPPQNASYTELANFYAEEATRRFDSLPPLLFSPDEDYEIVDSLSTSFRSQMAERSW